MVRRNYKLSCTIAHWQLCWISEINVSGLKSELWTEWKSAYYYIKIVFSKIMKLLFESFFSGLWDVKTVLWSLGFMEGKQQIYLHSVPKVFSGVQTERLKMTALQHCLVILWIICIDFKLLFQIVYLKWIFLFIF